MEEDYRKLIIKFLSHEISDDEISTLKAWLEKNKANRHIFDEENELWQESDLTNKEKKFQPEIGWNEIEVRLGFDKKMRSPVFVINKIHVRAILAAASVFIIFFLGYKLFWHGPETIKYSGNKLFYKVQTNEGDRASIILPDSTLIIMNSGSTIEYSSDFNINSRNIYLQGEAYFNVHKNSELPFKVNLSKMAVIATGTKFNILSYSNEDIVETTLEEGSIKVEIKDKNSIEVQPGQQVIYYEKSGQTVVRNVAPDTYTSWKENKLRLSDTSLEEAFRRIARRYNVTFEIRSYELLEIKYTATFIDESIEDVMQMLKDVSPIKYRIINRTAISDKKYTKPKIIVDKR